MITININDATAKIPRLIEQAMAGEDVVFCQDNTPVFRLTPVPGDAPKKRMPSLGNPPCAAKFSDDAFDPLPEDMWNMFNGYDDKHGL